MEWPNKNKNENEEGRRRGEEEEEEKQQQQHLLCARHHGKHFTSIISLNPTRTPFYR